MQVRVPADHTHMERPCNTLIIIRVMNNPIATNHANMEHQQTMLHGYSMNDHIANYQPKLIWSVNKLLMQVILHMMNNLNYL